MIELPSQNRERRFSDRNSERGADTERISRGKKNKGRKRRGERASPLPEIANQIVHINQFELSEVLIQRSEGYILEARKTEKEDGRGKIQGQSMASIFKGLAEAKQKEENFKKR